MKTQIRSRYTGTVLFESDDDTIALCLQAAVKAGADLHSADLRGADLRAAAYAAAYAAASRADARKTERDWQEATLISLLPKHLTA